MPVFYSGRDVRITHRSFRVLGPVQASYAIAEIRSVWVVVPAPDHRQALVRISCSSGAVAVAALVATGSDHPAGWVLIVLVIVTIVALLVRTGPPTPPPRFELVAAWRGTSICIYATSDPTEFGQVRRALQRAIEWTEDAESN